MSEESAGPDDAVVVEQADYNAVVDSAELENIILVGVDFKMRPPALSTKRQEIEFAFDVDIKTDEPATDGVAVAMFVWNVTAKKKTDEGEPEEAEPLVSIGATWVAQYKGLTGKDPAAIDTFMRTVGRFATYPYFRALVAQLSWSSGANLPVMPIIRSA